MVLLSLSAFIPLGLLILSASLSTQKPVEVDRDITLLLRHPKLQQQQKHPSVLLAEKNDELLNPIDNLIEPDGRLVQLQDQQDIMETTTKSQDAESSTDFFPLRVGFVTVHRIPEEILRIMENNRYADSSDFRRNKPDNQQSRQEQKEIIRPAVLSLQPPVSDPVYPEPIRKMQAPHPEPPTSYPVLSRTISAPLPPLDRKSNPETESEEFKDKKIEAYFDSLLPGPHNDIPNPFGQPISIHEEQDPVFQSSLHPFVFE